MIAVPQPVFDVCQKLQDAGYEAFTVGGAVRDAILNRPVGDWDVATSALPAQVEALFEKTIPTGIEHGTVTVLAGAVADRVPVEVTTYRCDGDYSDGRRPDTVVFGGVSLEEDLARRDFVINAMAYDPIAHNLRDPFGGQKDLLSKRVRAVGCALDRFREDGLRVMRAVRFAAVLGFELESETEAAIPGALDVLAKVARERVHDELVKLLRAHQPSRGLDVAERSGIIGSVLPELTHTPQVWAHTVAAINAATTLEVRLAALFIPACQPATWPRDDHGAETADAALRRLKFSNHHRDLTVRLVRFRAAAIAASEHTTDADVRQMMGEVGRSSARLLVELWRAEQHASHVDTQSMALHAFATRVESILERGDALCVADLHLSGADVLSELKLPPGRIVGQVLTGVLHHVLRDPSQNRPNALRTLVHRVAQELGIG